jgi:hypothetical protein
MKNQYEIRKAAEAIIEEMGGNPEDICTGECVTFAKRLIDAIGCGEIVNGLSNEMQDELEDYPICAPDYKLRTSHCWVKVDRKCFDAFNPEGVDNESELEFYSMYA